MKLRVRFLQLPIRFDAERLAREVAALPQSAWRPHPQGYPGNDALPLITTNGDPASDARNGAMMPTTHLLACPYLMQALDALGATWGRSRLMRLSGDAEVTPHVDTDYYWRDHMRVHVPIVTQPTVRFLCGGDQVNMAAGECWVFDTWSLHSVHNDATRARIHLVADTVGGAGLTELMEGGRPAGARSPGWTAPLATPTGAVAPDLAYESRNLPTVMTPWELRDHIGFLMSELAEVGPKSGAAGQVLVRLRNAWHGLWARSGDDREAWDDYAALLQDAWSKLQAIGVADVPLKNGMSLGRCLRALVFESALGGRSTGMDVESRAAPGTANVSPATRPGADPMFDRPIFIVSGPRSGSTLLFETLAAVTDLATSGGESHALMEAVPAIDPAGRGWDSNRLTGADATAETMRDLRNRFRAALKGPGGSVIAPGPLRMLEKTPKNALRIPFLVTAFPEARFVYLYRDARPTLASMIEGWRSGQFRTYPTLPGWSGLDWSFLLTPGWRDLIGQSLEQIVARQWAETTRILLDDLAALPPDRWVAARYDRFLAAPGVEIDRLCAAVDVRRSSALPATLPLSRHTLTKPDPEKWRIHADAIEATASLWSPQEERALELVR